MTTNVWYVGRRTTRVGVRIWLTVAVIKGQPSSAFPESIGIDSGKTGEERQYTALEEKNVSLLSSPFWDVTLRYGVR